MESSRKKSSSVVGSSRRHRTYLYFVISKYGRQYGWNGRKIRIDGRFLGGVWDEYTEYRYAAGIFCNGDRHDTCAWKQYVCGNTGNGDPVERGRWTHGGIYLYLAGCAGEDHHCKIRGGDRKSCAFYDFLRGMLSDWFSCTWRKRNYRGIPPFYSIAAYDEYRDCVHLFPDFGGQ